MNKASDMVPDRAMADALGWLGQGFKPPPGPPWPWEQLRGQERDAFERACRRLVLSGEVPERAAQILCWANGAWQSACTAVLQAEAIQVYPERQHIRLVPKAVWYVDPKPWELPG